MKNIYILTIGLLTFSCFSYGQKTLQLPTEFPLQPLIQSNIKEQVIEYTNKNLLQSINSISSGNWTDVGTWNCACIPSFEDEINIMPGHEVIINQDINLSSIFIDSTAILNTTLDTVEISLTGDWINNGEFIPNNSKVILSGYDDQSITGLTTFNNLTILHDRNAIIMSAITISNTLTIEDVSLITNDLLTLGYANGKTAELAQVLTGAIQGDIIAESSIELAYGNWFSTASPVTDATINQWNDDIVTSGFTGSDFPDYPFNNITYFTETSGYVNVNNINDSIFPGTGYFIYENAGIHPYDLQGTPIIGNFSFPTSYTNSLPSEDRGWNLLGNPYVATIDWSKQEGWTKENIGDALYLWDVNTQAYKVYMNGYSINGGNPIIKPFDNFFVAATNDPYLSINEYAKVTEDYIPETPQDNFFKFIINGTSTADEIIIIMDDSATNNYDLSNDAIRAFNNINTEICTVSNDGQYLCINSLPTNESGLDIPLIINSPSGGTFTLDVLNMPAELTSCVAIENLLTNEIYNLQETSSITFTISPTYESEIFMLHIGGSITETTMINVTCNGSNNGSITVTGSGDGHWDYFWYNQNEELVFLDLDQHGPSTLDSIPAGIYTITLGNLDFCPALTQTIEIEEPPMLLLEADITQPDCNNPNSGEIISLVSGGNGNYTYDWSNGLTDSIITNLTGGTYELTVTDMDGCEIAQSYIIEDAIMINASFEINQIIPLAGGLNEVSFTNNSDNADSYLWNFGDGSSETEENPTHIYTEPGEYEVTLTVFQGDCSVSFNYTLTIEDSTISVDELSNQENISISTINGEYSLLFNLETSQEVEISINNLLGQEISKVTTQIQNDYYQLELPQGKNQVFFVIVSPKNDQTRKIFKVIQR